MIFRIEIENFLSIRDQQSLDLTAAGHAPVDTDRLTSCWKGSRERAPKVVAVFGANAAGKSNLLRALSHVYWFISNSFESPVGIRTPFFPFNDQQSFEKPTVVRIWKSGEDWHAEDVLGDTAECPHCYEVAFDNTNDGTVLSESIFYWPTVTGRKTRLIERFQDGSVKAGKVFRLSGFKQALENVLRPNASVISTLAQLNHPMATAIKNSAGRTRSNLTVREFERHDDKVSKPYLIDERLVQLFNREVSRLDVGVLRLEITKSRIGPQLVLRHEGLTRPMSLNQESHGTLQFVRMFPLIADVLETGSIAVLDGLDTTIHSMLLREIIDWFYDPERNPHNAQLWMSCQNVPLLEELTKEEIVFCEKDRRGATEIYALTDITGVRRDDNYLKKYLGGVFGAVPRIG